jgi:CheY-like chemotaxis protein
MGGKIGLQSTLGVGSTFWVDLKLTKQAISTGPESNFLKPGTRILVVDDHPTNRLILRDQLGFWGCVPTLAVDGFEALELAKTGDFDLVLLDYHMPGMDGISTRERLRQIPAMKTVPIVLLTSSHEHSIGAKVLFDAVMHKPIRQANLRAMLVRLLSGGTEVVANRRGQDKPTVSLGLKVLIAEDNLVNAIVAKGRLEIWGCEYVEVVTGVEAVAAFEREHFDLILMDVSMPEMDGFQATLRIRELEKTRGIRVPVIAMTAHAGQGDRERCLISGMDDYLPKPINQEEMLTKIRFWGKKLG